MPEKGKNSSMYILANMVKNLWRNRGRNLLFAGTVFVVIAICTTGVLIRNAAADLVDNYKQELSVKTIIIPDLSKMTGGGGGIKKTPLEPAKVKSFGDSDLLKSARYQVRLNVELKDLKAVGDGESGGMGGASGGNTEEFRMPTGAVIGSNDAEISSDFKEGKRKMVEGRIYKDANEAIISEQLAKLNNLSVGDTIKIDRSKGKSSPETLTITGIYSDSTMEGNTSNPLAGMAVADRNNEVLVSEDTATNLKMFPTAGTLEAEYYLKNPDLIEDFRKEVKAKGLPDSYKLYANEAAYKQAAGPLESLQQISTIFLLIVVILGAVVLLFLSLMTIRARQREIGVLRTIGMKKSAISLGLIGETLAIVAICLALGLGVGNVAAQPIGHSMLDNQIAAQKENQASGSLGEDMVLTTGGLPVDSQPAETKDITVKLDDTALLQIVALSLVITFISAGVGIWYTTRLEPMKILSEGN